MTGKRLLPVDEAIPFGALPLFRTVSDRMGGKVMEDYLKSIDGGYEGF